MKIAILGAGPGALTLAACLSLKGHSINLYEQPDFVHNITRLVESKTVNVDGYVKGSATLSVVTLDLEEAVADAAQVFIVTHAAAHAVLAKKLAPLLKPHHSVVLFPGYVAGAFDFARQLQTAGVTNLPPLAESSVLPFACRRVDPESVFVGGWKKEFILASADTGFDTGPLEQLFGPIPISSHMLEAGLNETNFIIHPVIALLNISLVSNGHPWTFYNEGLTPGIGAVLEAADKERLALMAKLDLPQIPLYSWLLRFYESQGAAGGSCYEVLKSFDYLASSKGPTSFSHRYFTEDIPYGLVPLANLGCKYQVPMPVVNMILDLAELMLGSDFRNQGRQL